MREFEHQPVDGVGRHAGRDMLGQHVEAARRQLPGLAHAFKGSGPVDFDLSGLAEGGDGGVDVGHGAQCKDWPRPASGKSGRPPSVGELSDFTAQLVLDMGADDVVEGRLGRKTERRRRAWRRSARASRRRCARPAGRARGGCGRRPSAPATRVSASICSPTVQQTPGMVRLMRSPSWARVRPAAWIRKPTAERGLACQCSTLSATGSSASWPASGSRMMPEKKPEAALFGLPGRTTIDRQADADAVEKAAPRIVGQQQFADRLLRAVGGERRQMEFVGNGVGERRAEHRDRRGEDELRLVAVAGQRGSLPAARGCRRD